MNRRQKILIVVAILLVVAAALFLLWSLLQAPTTVNAPVTEEPSLNRPIGGLGGNQTVGGGKTTTNAAAQPSDNVPTTSEQPAVPPGTPDERSNVTRVAMAFAERFGSFSNTSDFSNILDQEPIMTAAMIAWAENYVAEQRASGAISAEYYGTTTRALSSSLSRYDALRGIASVKIMTQRLEQKATGATSTYYQEITVEMRKQGDVWRVDSATWGNKQ